ncbi:hypothetical protein Q0A17_16995 [Citrobacter sp. S2-9]|uniref:Uncharacterized protein n=1 Tax=Citrobacter enshiensis TaxID=2971264 RepID=A0ABT8PXJ8_9ENTR|nr:hypothetical protein [Citrobacter enshiensis]MDN8601092.1 hypothetical protein [Citrobacter enshiensis]
MPERANALSGLCFGTAVCRMAAMPYPAYGSLLLFALSGQRDAL